MRIVSIGGGPAGLYAAILLKKSDPSRHITVFERNRPDDTFGFGVVFSDATLGAFAAADAESYEAIRARFARWDDLDIHYGGTIVTSHGHGFAGMGRKELLEVLRTRAVSLGVEVRFSAEIAPGDLDALAAEADVVLAADGVNSLARKRWGDDFGARVDLRPNRFVWLGTTFPFRAFTFYFKRDAAGLFRVHAYRYAPDQSTFIVECTEETFRNTGLGETDEAATVAYCQRLFTAELDGHALLQNRSHWRQFPTVRCDRWWRGNVALVGDAVHTAHFSIGSGTKLAMEGAIALAAAIDRERAVPAALAAYEQAHRRTAERLQAAAQVSLRWFEETERYFDRLAPLPFAFNLLTRSLRITHASLKERDPELIARLNREFAAAAAATAAGTMATTATAAGTVATAAPPLFAPLRLGDLVLRNRAVAQLPVAALDRPTLVALDRAAPDGVAPTVLDSAALDGAGLVLAEAGARDGDAWARALAAARRVTAARVGLTLPADDAAAVVQDAHAAFTAGYDLLMLRSDDPALVAAARAVWPASKPLLACLGDSDDATARARALAEAGTDLVVVTGDGRDHAAEVRLAERIRLEAGVPSLVAVTDVPDANSVLGAGRADLCLIPAVPGWVRAAATAFDVTLAR